MRIDVPQAALLSVLWIAASPAAQSPSGPGMTEANQERLVLDDMEDVSDWSNSSPEETPLSRSQQHVKEGQFALLFANRVDHTKGEKNYPVGWPRVSKSLVKAKLTDWSAYDFFQCWIYAQTSREALPGSPLSIQFSHTGQKRSTSVVLREVKKDQWTKVVVPVPKLDEPRDVQRIQFSFGESSYAHGDRVDFFISGLALVRFVRPAINTYSLDCGLRFGDDRALAGQYSLVGHEGLDTTAVELEIGRGEGPALARTSERPPRRLPGQPAPQAEIVLRLPRLLPPGEYWARLQLRSPAGEITDRRQVSFRVIPGPFENAER